MIRGLGLLGVLAIGVVVATGLSGAAGLSTASEDTGTLVSPGAPGAPAGSGAGGVGGVHPDPAWVRRVVVATGIPRPAVRAYGRAELLVGREQPECHLGWTTLAGIGRTESGHGTFGGRRLGPDGRASTPITGPELDGTSYAAVREGAHWASARGPLQFIPSTWRQWGADGDGDGRADVDDLDDAALAAGRYLCADGHDLATAPGWNAAVLGYNHSTAYVQEVYAAADRYARLTNTQNR